MQTIQLDYDLSVDGALPLFKEVLSDKFKPKFWEALEKARTMLGDTSDIRKSMEGHPWLSVLLNDLFARVDIEVVNTESRLAKASASLETAIRQQATLAGSKKTNDAVRSEVSSDPEVTELEASVARLKSLRTMVQGFLYAAKDRSEILREISTNERAFYRANQT